MDLSGETSEKAFFGASQINENVKLDEVILIEVDTLLSDRKGVLSFLSLKHETLF